MSARKSRTRAAVVAAELEKRKPSMQSPGGQGLTADGKMGLPLLSLATWPQPRQLWHRISPFSEA
eukprot:5433625-Pleurochrysis_carterae.AAC.1